jgi:hypothetical protein
MKTTTPPPTAARQSRPKPRRVTVRSRAFCAFILSHGRADRVYTYETLRRSGYTGRIVIVIDNEDPQGDAYRARYGDEVVVFDKAAAACYTDAGDNLDSRRGVVYARNACWSIARDLGVRRWVQLDDDYIALTHKRDSNGAYIDGREIKNFDAVLDAMLAYYERIPALSIAMSQTGDFPGGSMCTSRNKHSRKAMNSFIMSIDRPFSFPGRINEDTSAYVTLGARGALFLTIKDVALQQKQTQKNAGGMTGLYLDGGTYMKSFYSVMMQPSSVRIFVLPTAHPRIHHKVTWRHTVAKILRPEHRKPRPDQPPSTA